MDAVTVVYHYEDGLWWAESPEVPEFSGGGNTYVEAQAAARDGLAFALEHPVVLDERLDEAARAARERVTSVRAYGVDVHTATGTCAADARPSQRAYVAASVQHVRRGVATSAS